MFCMTNTIKLISFNDAITLYYMYIWTTTITTHDADAPAAAAVPLSLPFSVNIYIYMQIFRRVGCEMRLVILMLLLFHIIIALYEQTNLHTAYRLVPRCQYIDELRK